MSKIEKEIKSGTMELFQGEVLGEVVFDKLLAYFKSPEEQYKIATLLQLETETKARLRAYMFSLQMDLHEDDVWRQRALDLAASYKGKSWGFVMADLNETLKKFVARYKEIASEVPAAQADIYHYMVEHESSLLKFTELELSDDSQHSLDAVIAQLKYPLLKPKSF